MVSVKHESAVVAEALDAGANDYIIKPIDFPVLHARVKTQLGGKRAMEALNLYAQLVSSASDAITLVDRDYKYRARHFAGRDQ